MTATKTAIEPSILAVIEAIKASAFFPILRMKTPDDALWLSKEILSNGIKVLEVTMDTPQARDIIRTLRQEFPDCVIGAGTVMDYQTAEKAQKAGAQFLVSPVLDEALIKLGIDNKILVVPGVMTPTEAQRAHSLGASVVKVFPINVLGGSAYIKAILGPLPHLKCIPTGGVQVNEISDLLDAGAIAVGIGSRFVSDKDAINKRDSDAVATAIQETRDKVG